jgi:hypothetical protein
LDDHRFDRLTRTLAEPNTRRRFAAGMAAAALALIGVKQSGAASCRNSGVSCNKNADCCGGYCGPKDSRGRRICGCGPGQQLCNGICIPDWTCCGDADCSENHSCLNGGCFRNDGNCDIGCNACVSEITTEENVACSGLYIQGGNYSECESTDDCPLGYVCGGDVDNGNGGSYCFPPCEFTIGEVSIAC